MGRYGAPIEFTCVPRALVQSPLCLLGFSNCLVLSIDTNTRGRASARAHVHTRDTSRKPRSSFSMSDLSCAEVAYGLVDLTVLKRAWHNVLSSRPVLCPESTINTPRGDLFFPDPFMTDSKLSLHSSSMRLTIACICVDKDHCVFRCFSYSVI